jgi:hypothetical protein
MEFNERQTTKEFIACLGFASLSISFSLSTYMSFSMIPLDLDRLHRLEFSYFTTNSSMLSYKKPQFKKKI